ncbi:hypothetical protein LINPERHAP2_LOCUS23801 [Linum perenne]
MMDSDDKGASIPGGILNMAVDPPVPQPRLSSENRGVVGEPKSNERQTKDDGWTVVSSDQSRGRRIRRTLSYFFFGNDSRKINDVGGESSPQIEPEVEGTRLNITKLLWLWSSQFPSSSSG